jgi:hypothetical protein
VPQPQQLEYATATTTSNMPQPQKLPICHSHNNSQQQSLHKNPHTTNCTVASAEFLKNGNVLMKMEISES